MTHKNISSLTQKIDEQILVVARQDLLGNDSWFGLKTDNIEQYIDRVREHKQFKPRSLMETDPLFKQIIPYVIFTHNDLFFLMERSSNASEQRLQSKLTLGIGGHVREHDMRGRSIVDWAYREFHEEVNYTGGLNITVLGLLNDDSDEVGKVHLGIVLLANGDNPNISIKSELSHGFLAKRDECRAAYSKMEGWSRLVFDALCQMVSP